MLIRNFTTDDADELRLVFYSSVHSLAQHFYTRDQLNAWAPDVYDRQSWLQRLAANRPFIAVLDGQIAGFADIQNTGYIDQFFTAGLFAQRGVGSALMHHILKTAAGRNTSHIYSNVSLAAEDFFSKYGFRVTKRQIVSVSGVQMQNARMERSAG